MFFLISGQAGILELAAVPEGFVVGFAEGRIPRTVQLDIVFKPEHCGRWMTKC